MKKILWAAFSLCVFLPVAAEAQTQAPAPAAGASPAASAPSAAPAHSQGRKKRVAVFDFDYATVQKYSDAAFGANIDVGKGIADLLVKHLVKDGTYSVIERKAMDKILAEQNFSNSDRANPNSAAKLGKLLGVDARIVDIDTAEILGVADGKGESSRENTSLLGGGSNWHGWGGGAVDFGSSDFAQTILGEAVNVAVTKLSTGVISDNSKLQARTISVEGLVAAVDGGQIIVNVGAKVGLKVGDQLTVERVTKEIKDPATGKLLRRMATAVGAIKVTDVDDISAVAVAVSGTGFKVGDAVRTVTQ